jgi:hypothetical protein
MNNCQKDTEELVNNFQEALSLIRESATLFRFYEKNHREKIKPLPYELRLGSPEYVQADSRNIDAFNKAERNREIAEKLEKFLRPKDALERMDKQ